MIRGEGQLVVVLQAAQKSYSDIPGRPLFDGLVPGNSVYYTSRWRRTQHISTLRSRIEDARRLLNNSKKDCDLGLLEGVVN